ncbi:hypothetical protein C9374_000493 [Naegleria lovaniensis]|uniref:Uncharacterized protein n=1 Tax=Naegleria lovaniensis TaxID=51637 RepID=A0AA88KNS8_NAELO|nr:uncharacterized protein C9374_000493 [Naegleria lovaniensis]KAG2388329.1 hypothetical protein C9374_000493 [Naegleria lovaniensis]
MYLKRLKNSLLNCMPHHQNTEDNQHENGMTYDNSLELSPMLSTPTTPSSSTTTNKFTSSSTAVASPTADTSSSTQDNLSFEDHVALCEGSREDHDSSNDITLKHIHIQCYKGRESQALFHPHPTITYPKTVKIEWVFDDCIRQRLIHKMLKKSIEPQEEGINFSDISIVARYDSSELDYDKKKENRVFTISQDACSLIPCIQRRIEPCKPQTIELQIPFCFHFAIDYPEDSPSSPVVSTGSSSSYPKVTLEGCVVFSSEVFLQLIKWCEHYSKHREFIQSDLEGKGMVYCSSSESYFRSVIGEWNWNFLNSLSKNLLLQCLIMSHILSIHTLLVMFKTKIMFDVKQKCREKNVSILNSQQQGSTQAQSSYWTTPTNTKIQFLNYFVQDSQKVNAIFHPHQHVNYQKVATSARKRITNHVRSNSYDKIRGLTGNNRSNVTSMRHDASAAASASTSTSNVVSSSSNNNHTTSSHSTKEEPHIIATLGNSKDGFIHFLRIK